MVMNHEYLLGSGYETTVWCLESDESLTKSVEATAQGRQPHLSSVKQNV